MPGAYLDHAATTPMRPEALAALAEASAEVFANPSGSHAAARRARRALDDARDVVADVVGAHPAEVVFTSGGTEADNLAVTGVARASAGRVLCSAVEHHAVLSPTEVAGGSTVAVRADGALDLGALERALATGAPVALLSVMTANNETGALTALDPVADVVARCSPHTVIHTDAVAAAPWLHLPEHTGRAHLVSVSGHKVGGPKGIGALVVRSGTPLAPILVGGGQEQERRGGTPNVAGAVAFAAALAAAVRGRAQTVARVEALRTRLVTGLVAAVPDAVVVSPSEPGRRTAGTVMVCFSGVDREALLFSLDQAEVAASWGASCSSGATAPSHVLAAMGVAPDLAAGALRLSLGWCSTDADVDHVLAVLPDVVARLRAGADRPAAARLAP